VGAPGAFTGGPEDVIYGALQFYDAIASQPVVNFTATVNNVGSIIGPNGPGATTGPGASAQIIYSNWQQQLINIPPGCTVTPVVLPLPGPPPAGNPLAANYGIGADGTRNAFIITPVTGNPAVFTISVNASAAFPGVIGTPGVVTELIVFNKAGT